MDSSGAFHFIVEGIQLLLVDCRVLSIDSIFVLWFSLGLGLWLIA
jgi:hypothetical protein